MENFHLTTEPRVAMSYVEKDGERVLDFSLDRDGQKQIQIPVTITKMNANKRTAEGKDEDGNPVTREFYIFDVVVAKRSKGQIVLDENQQPIEMKAQAVVSAKQVEKVEEGISYWATMRALPNNPAKLGLNIGGLRVDSGLLDAEDFDFSALLEEADAPKIETPA